MSNSVSVEHRNARVNQHAAVVAEAVRQVHTRCGWARQIPDEELEQVGQLALTRAADNCTNDNSFHAYALARVAGALRNYVNQWHRGRNYQRLAASGIEIRTVTNVSAIENYNRLTPTTGGNAHWVRDTIGRPPRSICAMFASAGYTVSSDAQGRRLVRRVSKMVM